MWYVEMLKSRIDMLQKSLTIYNLLVTYIYNISYIYYKIEHTYDIRI